jgi:hypothetical protein
MCKNLEAFRVQLMFVKKFGSQKTAKIQKYKFLDVAEHSRAAEWLNLESDPVILMLNRFFLQMLTGATFESHH